jgi:lysophospholipase L1-like esterase
MKQMMAAVACVVCVSMGVPSQVQAEDYFFKDGDRVVMLGDSITEWMLYTNYVETWTLTRFPKWNITFRNSGIGGNVSTDGNKRFERDVLVHKPTAMTINFGMNDCNIFGTDENKYSVAMTGLNNLAEKAKAANIRVAWLTPNAIENEKPGPIMVGRNATIEKASMGMCEVAKKYNGVFIDMFHPFVTLLEKARAENPKNQIGGGGAVHPEAPGHTILAWVILKELHFPTLVSSAEIDAAQKKIVKAEQCEISHVIAKDGGISFQRLDAALPFFPIKAKSILKWTPIETDLNEYMLKVVGLAEGKYEIRIDGIKVSEQSSVELTTGVNLTNRVLSAGPIADQVKAVWDAVVAKNSFYHDKIFRGIIVSPVAKEWPGTPAEVEANKKNELEKRTLHVTELESEIHKALVIKPHQFEIVLVKK